MANTKVQKKQAPKAEQSSTTTEAVAAPVVAAPVVAAPVVAPVVAAPVVAAPVVAAPAKKSKGKQAAAVVAAPVVATPVAAKEPKAKATKKAAADVPVTPAVVAQEGGAKKTAKAAKKATPAAKTAKTAKAAKIAKAPKEAKPKTAKAQKAKKTATETADENSEELEGGKRSFKAMLPGSEKFEGRYTGLTPYQAANKALSKYYREATDGTTAVEKSGSEITFSIRESTRGSKRAVYTYNGRREKLATPVEYTIKGKDGDRVVKKEFKNRLTKVKKAETTATEATESA